MVDPILLILLLYIPTPNPTPFLAPNPIPSPTPSPTLGFAIITWNNPKKLEKPWITKEQHLAIFTVDFIM